MHVDVSCLKGVRGEKISIQRTLDEKFLASSFFKGLTFIGLPAVSLQLTNTGNSILVQGEIRGSVLVSCSRCLREFKYSFIAPVEELFYQQDYPPLIDANPLKEKGLSFEEIISNHYTGNVIDLTEVLQQSILLHLPLKPLCDEACRGLCEVCGANLNDGDCGCHIEQIDPRWEALKKLKE